MKNSIYTKVASGACIFLFPVMVSCSSLFGGGTSSDPALAYQQRQIETLEQELKEAERLAEEAEQREKAAKARLKAAKYELKALQSQAKNRGNG